MTFRALTNKSLASKAKSTGDNRGEEKVLLHVLPIVLIDSILALLPFIQNQPIAKVKTMN